MYKRERKKKGKRKMTLKSPKLDNLCLCYAFDKFYYFNYYRTRRHLWIAFAKRKILSYILVSLSMITDTY